MQSPFFRCCVSPIAVSYSSSIPSHSDVEEEESELSPCQTHEEHDEQTNDATLTVTQFNTEESNELMSTFRVVTPQAEGGKQPEEEVGDLVRIDENGDDQEPTWKKDGLKMLDEEDEFAYQNHVQIMLQKARKSRRSLVKPSRYRVPLKEIQKRFNDAQEDRSNEADVDSES
eukprot:TRINITY_DN3730_c0_g1_i1.p1 TRINITY_DN3730_c0_g1~~TRINITY_DN3730_c0_g1_i1.p1  ORF type:complete len:172 (+),score=24.28 TRINITY_DN3730_c0_g1_i1:64-579(+)